MKKSIPLTIILGSVAVTPVYAATMTVNVEIPRLNVAEYHRPYVAVWLESADGTTAANLSVWYQQKTTSEGAGTKWLPDLRQWWRKSGRTLKVPVDGVTGPTRPAGRHAIKIPASRMAKVKPGSYTLIVEAVREVGGRELVKIPLTIAPGKPASGSAKGSSELGAVNVSVTP